MNNSQISNIAKFTFCALFIAGNSCLFGHLLFPHFGFAIAGFFLLYIGSFISLIVLSGLLIYGFFKNEQMKICLKSSAILLINIPIAALYAYIGLELI